MHTAGRVKYFKIAETSGILPLDRPRVLTAPQGSQLHWVAPRPLAKG